VTVSDELADGHAVDDDLVIDDQRRDLAGRVVVARFLAAGSRGNDLILLTGFLQHPHDAEATALGRANECIHGLNLSSYCLN
jgi:hypothetical protein